MSNSTFLHPYWWRLGTAAILRAAEGRGWHAGVDSDGASLLGHAWDGRSDIELQGWDEEAECETVAADTVAALVQELRVSLEARSVRVARLPESRSVRVRAGRGTTDFFLTIDIDLGEFILPVSVSGSLLARHPDITAEIAAGMMDTVLGVAAIRNMVAARERRLRRALEEQSIRAHVTPLWFRMMPWTFSRTYTAPFSDAREFAVLMLDEDLRPTIRHRLTNSVADIELYLGFHGDMQRRRSKMRSKLDAAGSAGFFTEVALGIVEARGLDPREVLTYLRVSRMAKRFDGILHRTDTTRETLTLVEGVVEATIDFKGGNYASGRLTLDGDYPRSLAMSAKRRPLTAFVDHPAFRAAGVTIRQARALRGRLRLYHLVRTVPMEQAAQGAGGLSAPVTVDAD